MDSSEISPKRRRLNLNRKPKQENEDSQSAELDNRKKNFIKACLQVSYESYRDYQKRFQLLYVPGCINNECNHGDRNANINQLSRSAEQTFKTEIKNSTWYPALEICLMCISSCQYLSANVLMDIVEIMMNAHEDLDTGYATDYLMRKCQHTLMIHFNMHPPCNTKLIRDCYKNFLTSPMERKEFSNREQYVSDEGIVSHCFSRLMYEISTESNDGTLIEEQEVPTEIEGVKRLHWKKENLELFELLIRTERIERCMLVLETIIYLLQIDLALWHARRSGTDNRMRSQKPLLALLLWPYNCLTHGTVTRQCRNVMELFAYYIHLQYPERHIKTMSLWMNAIVQMFYMYDRHSDVDYPTTSSYCTAFAKEFYKVISPLPNTSISRILERIKPYFMQYLLGIRHVQTVLDFNQNDILYIIIWCINNMSWKDYPIGEQKPIICKNSRLKTHKLLDYLSRTCRNKNVAINEHQNSYPKLELRENENEIQQNYIINILFTTFVAYLETYSIKNFQQTLENYNKNDSNCDQINYKYSVTDNFVKQYRYIIKSLQELLVLLKEKKDDPSKRLSDLINVYFS